MKNLELLKKIKDITSSSLNIMNGKEKGDIRGILNEIVTVNGYEFGMGQDNSEYVVFTTKENDMEFYFGSSVITESFKKLDDILEGDKEILVEGIEIILHEKKSKNNRRYTYCEFFPNA